MRLYEKLYPLVCFLQLLSNYVSYATSAALAASHDRRYCRLRHVHRLEGRRRLL